MQDRIAQILRSSARVHDETAATLCEEIARAAQLIIDSLGNGGKLALCGNGGSAADAQHIAGELISRFQMERRPLPAIALTTDTSVLTSISNDYGYRDVFRKQVEALLVTGDVLIALTTSGNSPNCLEAVRAAREQGVTTIAMTGAGGGEIARQVDLALIVPHEQTARIQETHITIAHALCELIEEALCGGEQ